MLDRLKSFSLSAIETQGIELLDEDIRIGTEEGNRSPIEKVFGEKEPIFRESEML